MQLRSSLPLAALLATCFALPPTDAQAQKKPPTRAIAINSTPAGAQVFLDNPEGTPLGVTPIKSVKVEYGARKFHFKMRGFKTEVVDVVIDGKSRKVEVALKPVAYIQVRAAVPEAEGASVSVNGNKLGNVPYDGEIVPGRHLFEITKDGFRTFSQWVELGGGQLYTLPLVLTSEKKPVGTLFVTADLPGVPVFVDGVDKGVTPVSLDLPPGQTLVEVRPKDLPLWKKQVVIVAGEKMIVEANVRPESAPVGAAMIISNIPNTLVFVNGVKTGTAPVTLSSLPVGTHIIEGKAQGFQPGQSTVRITAGEQTVVKLELKQLEAEYGRISVRASVPGAVVYIDGGERGPAPQEVDKMTLGAHSIVVRAKGYLDFEGSCNVLRNDTCSVMANLTALALIKVTADVPGASLSIDGKDIGPLPYEGALPAGSHKIAVSAKDYKTWETTLDFQPGIEPRAIHATLETGRPDEVAVAAKIEETYATASALTALPMGPGHNAIRLGFSYPYIVEASGSVGIVPGIAAGVSLRALERSGIDYMDTVVQGDPQFEEKLAAIELALHFYAGIRPLKPLSFGVEVEGYMGTNFSDINTRGLTVYGKGTLHFGEVGAFTLRMGAEVVRDGWEPTAGVVPAGSRDTAQVAGRFRIGATVLLWASDNFGFYIGLDKVVGDERLILARTLFGAVDSDPQLYFHAGVVFGN